MSEAIRVSAEVLRRLVEEARREPTVECCGLLAGTGGMVTTVLPAENALGSATAYEIAPADLFPLFRRMREQGLDHLGIYHSHPATENAPSPNDIVRAFYPDAVYFIVSPREDEARPVRAFEIREGGASEREIVEQPAGK